MPCPGDPGPRPSFIPLPNCARMVMKYTLFGQTVENVFYFEADVPFSEAECQGLALEAEAEWGVFIKPLLPSAITLDTITVTGTDVQNAPQYIAEIGAAGTSADPAFPDPGATFAIKFGTAKTGRSYRGRAYWPCLQTTGIASGVIALVQAAGYLGAYTDFFGGILTNTGLRHVIASYQKDCEWRTTGVATTVTSYTFTDRNLDSQRRRLPGRGI